MQSECFVCNNCHLVASIYEEALRRGYEAHYDQADPGLWFVEVFCITLWELRQIELLARSGAVQLPLVLA